MIKKEKRGLERTHLTLQLNVLNSDTEEIMGQIENITHEGIRLLCDRQIEPGAAYTLKIELPVEDFQENINPIEAKCIWCNIDDNINLYHAGLQFKYFDAGNDNIVRQLIEKYAANS